MNRFAICFGLIGACVLAVPSQATVTITANPQAISETNIGSAFAFTRRFYGYINDVKQNGLTADVVFTLTSVTNAGRRWAFTAEITNNTRNNFSASTLGLFGMSTDNPAVAGSQVLTLSSVTTPAATPFTVRNNNNTTGFTVPDLAPNVQFCLKTGGTTGECDTIGSGGVAKGNSLTQAFTLNFSAAPGMINLENFVARFRDVSGNARDGSNNVVVVSNIYASAAGEVVPEPSSWAMMIAGFGLVGAMRRRQQRSVATAA
jgi:hypothetical protein